MSQVHSVSIPEYKIDKKPDYEEVGRKIDEAIITYLSHTGRKVGLRYLSLQDHLGLTSDELIKIILETGTDRYDPGRKMSVAHDFYSEKGVELFVMPVTVDDSLHVSAGVIKDFYEGALVDRGYSLRIDLVVIYNLDHLVPIPIQYEDGPGEGDYKFRYPDRKADSVLGIIQVQ